MFRIINEFVNKMVFLQHFPIPKNLECNCNDNIDNLNLCKNGCYCY